MDYLQYIKSDLWKLRSREYRNNHPFCEICGCNDRFRLQTHHISYNHLGEEPDSDLMTLCKDCHKAVEWMKQNGGTDKVSPESVQLVISYNPLAFRKALGTFSSFIDKNLKKKKRNKDEFPVPSKYLSLCGSFTLLQQRILVAIAEQLKPRINNSIGEKTLHGHFSALFDDVEMEEDVVEVAIPVQCLKVTAQNYKRLQESAQQLMTMTIKIPVFFTNGHQIRRYESVHFIKGVTIQDCNLILKLQTSVILDLLSLEKGFVSFDSRIMHYAKKRRTLRLYCLLSKYRFIGSKTMTYLDLIEFFGLTADYGLDIKELAYAKWSVLKKKVIIPVMDELKELWEKGISPFYFDYSEEKQRGHKFGTPKTVTFTIKSAK